jgi:cytochrome P450
LFRKSDSYAATAFTGSIVGEQDPAEHAGMRNMLAPAFSDHALRLQLPLITDAVNRFISELGKRGKRGEPIDLGKYLTCASFDIATSLAFGKDLRSAETGDIHPWVVSLKHGARAMGDKVCLEMVKESVLPPPSLSSLAC